jgi:hypothetical protein
MCKGTEGRHSALMFNDLFLLSEQMWSYRISGPRSMLSGRSCYKMSVNFYWYSRCHIPEESLFCPNSPKVRYCILSDIYSPLPKSFH